MATKNPGSPTPEPTSEALVCGIVMPISSCDGCSEAHWLDVKDIIEEAITAADFDANLVSNATEVGVIQKRIIENLYYNPIIVCDVSGRNANVMLELGIRLAFDKPVIIIKDDKTPYSFDTSPIEHLQYPRDLRFNQIVDFKLALAEKIKNTHHRFSTDPTYTTFLKHFGTFKVAKLEKEEVSSEVYLLDEMRSLRSAFQQLTIGQLPVSASDDVAVPRTVRSPTLCFRETTADKVQEVVMAIGREGLLNSFNTRETGQGHFHLVVPRSTQLEKTTRVAVLTLARTIIPSARWLT